MNSSAVDRLHASDARRRQEAARLAAAFDLSLRAASPPLATALADFSTSLASDPAALVCAAIIEVADRAETGRAVAALDAVRQQMPRVPRRDALVGHALMAALTDVLGPALDEETRVAWADGYVRAVETVMAARRNRMDLVA